MRKKMFCVMLIVLILLTNLSFAAKSGTKPAMNVSGKYEYLLNNDGTAAFAGYHESKFSVNEHLSIKSFNVPEIIDGYQVTALYDYAFSSWLSLEELTIPNTIKTIGEGAFTNCGLSELVLPEGVEEIGPEAFDRFLRKLVLPSTLNAIDKKAFAKASENLKIVVVRDSYAEEFCTMNNLTFTYAETETLQKDFEIPTENIQAWYDYGFGIYLPKPILYSGEEPEINPDMQNDDEKFTAIINNAIASDYEIYIELLKQFRFVYILDSDDMYYHALNEDGYDATIYFSEDGLHISCTKYY